MHFFLSLPKSLMPDLTTHDQVNMQGGMLINPHMHAGTATPSSSYVGLLIPHQLVMSADRMTA